MSDIIESMLNRASSPKLTDPAPNKDQVETLLRCAIRAPDHCKLRPWRFVVIRGQALEQLGVAFEQSQPDADEVKRARLRAMPLRAPMIVVSIACLTPDHKKVPEWEQWVSVGIATQHMQLAAQAMGYGAMWRTGEMTEQAAVKAYLGMVEHEKIVAFLYIGTPDVGAKASEAATLDGVVEYRD